MYHRCVSAAPIPQSCAVSTNEHTVNQTSCRLTVYRTGIIGNNVMGAISAFGASKFALFVYGEERQTYCMHVCVHVSRVYKCAPNILYVLPIGERRNKRTDADNVWSPRYHDTIRNFIAGYAHSSGVDFRMALLITPLLKRILKPDMAMDFPRHIGYPTSADELEESPQYVRPMCSKIMNVLGKPVPLAEEANATAIANGNEDSSMSNYVQLLLSDATEFRSTEEEVFYNPPGTAAIDVIYHLLMTFLPMPVDALLRCGEIAEAISSHTSTATQTAKNGSVPWRNLQPTCFV